MIDEFGGDLDWFLLFVTVLILSGTVCLGSLVTLAYFYPNYQHKEPNLVLPVNVNPNTSMSASMLDGRRPILLGITLDDQEENTLAQVQETEDEEEDSSQATRDKWKKDFRRRLESVDVNPSFMTLMNDTNNMDQQSMMRRRRQESDVLSQSMCGIDSTFQQLEQGDVDFDDLKDMSPINRKFSNWTDAKDNNSEEQNDEAHITKSPAELTRKSSI